MVQPLSNARQLAMSQVQRVQLLTEPSVMAGPDTLYDVPRHLYGQGLRRVMLVTTPGFVRRGVVDRFVKAAKADGVMVEVFAEVTPDPDLSCVEAAGAFYQLNGCEAIVALGGGSVIDCAKVAGALVARPGKRARDLVGTMKVRTPTPFLVAVPTTAGTGSEATAAAVVTDPDAQRKYAVSDLDLTPDLAVLDPKLLVGLPPEMTAYTGMDALTHAVEAYTNRFGSGKAREYAKNAVQMIFKNLVASCKDGEDLAVRANMLTASYYAGIAFTNNMVGYVHALAHGIGGRYHVQHGLANAVLLPLVMEEFGAVAEPRLAELADAIGLVGADTIRTRKRRTSLPPSARSRIRSAFLRRCRRFRLRTSRLLRAVPWRRATPHIRPPRPGAAGRSRRCCAVRRVCRSPKGSWTSTARSA